MGKIEAIERAVWNLFTGSSHPSYRQALWRPTRQKVGDVAGWASFDGDPSAGGINRRAWHHVGVVAIKDNQLEALFERKNVRPAVAFAVGDMVVKGALASFNDIGEIRTLTSKDKGHAFRIGPEDAQFSMGIVDKDGVFISPEQQYFDVITFDELLPVDVIGSPYGAFEDVKFS